MKIFKKIKQHIFDKFKDYGLLKEVIPPYKSAINMYDLYDQKINTQHIQKFASQLLDTKNFYHKDKTIVLEKIYHDLKELNECMKPLKELGINYSIQLIGGAVRDYLLDKHEQIKDLDIVIELTASRYHSPHFIREELESFCSNEELDSANFKDDDVLYIKHNKLLQICLSRKANTDYINFLKYEDRVIGKAVYGENILQSLSGMIKTNGGVFNYELDLLITDDNTKYLINTIDFNICNAAIRVIETGTPGYNLFPPLSHLSERFYSSVQFFEDIMNKTVTFNVNKKTYEQIKHSLGDHKNRIMQKYPDYTLRVSGKHENEKEQSLIEKMMLCHELGESLELPKDQPIIKNKKMKL